MTAAQAFSEFKMPPEPAPVPSLSCDEESFVVLGKSLTSDLEDLVEEDGDFGKSIIQEAKQLIKDELAQIEQHSLLKLNGALSNHNIEADKPAVKEDPPLSNSLFHSANGNEIQMDRSSILPAMPQPEVLPRVEMEGPNNDLGRTISIISFSPNEFASEELQIKVTQLIEENVHLKDTIQQNNMSMKAQYDRIVAWQEDVQKVYQTHKEKFLQAREYIDGLKKENASLKQEIENLRCALNQQESEHNKTKYLLSQSSENNLREFELEIATKKIKDLENALENMIIKSDEVTNETTKWKNMEEKLISYEKELENAFKKISDLEKNEKDDISFEKIKELEEKLILSELSNERANKEIMKLNNQLENKLSANASSKTINELEQARNKITELEMVIVSSNTKPVEQLIDSSKVLIELEQARGKIAELNEILISRNATLLEANMRTKKTEEFLFESQQTVKKLEENVDNLSRQLEEAKIEVWKQKQMVSEKVAQIHMLQNMEVSKQKSQEFVPGINLDEISFLRQQLMQSQRALTQCEQNRVADYTQLELQKNEIADLRKQLEGRQIEGDNMFALQTQLEVYKNDFEAEREAKENLKVEKAQLSSDLQHLHRRNQQIQEEVEILREQLQQYGGLPHRRSESASSSQGSTGWNTGRSNERLYRCPKCNFAFSTLQAVENHVMRCIDLEGSLP